MSHALTLSDARGRFAPPGPDAAPDTRWAARRTAPLARVARRDRPTSLLVAIAIVLAVLFVVAPPSLAGGDYGRSFSDNGALVDATGSSLVELWGTASGEPPPSLRAATDYWARYHVAKAVIAGLLLVALVLIGLRIRAALARGDGGRRGAAALRAAGVLVAGLGLVAVALLMANVQGALAPLASLLSLVGPEQRTGEVGATVDQIRQALASGATPSASLQLMIDDFGRYHAVLAAMAAVVTAGFVVLAVQARRSRRAATDVDPRTRRRLRIAGVSAGGLALMMAVVTLANVSNAADPAQGLRLFFTGA